MTYHLHKGDLPEDLTFRQAIAIDTETLGLNNHRDKLCVVQISAGDGTAHLVQLDRKTYHAPRLKALLADKKIEKIFHFARFDLAVLYHYLGVWATPAYCTKIASRLVRTYSDQHGLKDLCSELLSKKISKQQQSSDWGADTLTQSQMEYAAADVLYLHEIKEKLDEMLKRDGRKDLAKSCFDFLQARATLDLAGWPEIDIFSHSST